MHSGAVQGVGDEPMNGLIRLFRDVSLRKKLIFSYLFVIIIPIAVLGTYSYRSAKADLERQLALTAENSANRLVSELSYRLERQEYPIKSIVFNPKVVQAVAAPDKDVYELAVELNEHVEPIFWNYLFFMPDMKEIVIYSENRTSPFGNFLHSAEEVRGEEWYASTENIKSVVWRSDGENLFATRNIYEAGREKRQGALYIRFDYNGLIREVAGKLGPSDGVVITAAGGGKVFSSFAEEEGAEAGEYLILRRDIPRTDWQLAYYAGKEHIREGTVGIVRATLVIIGVCIVVLLGVILLFSRTMLLGIRKLNERMKRVEEGDLNVIVPIPSKDEVGQLTIRFANMIKRINLLIEEAYVNRIARKEAELLALQAQINPHFLYNSLSLINSQAIEKDAYDVSRTVTLLAKFYRTTLNKGRDTISVRDELTNVQTYIEIQRIMCGYAFDAEYDLENDLFGHGMIKLVLQPIVENAIDHGLKEKREGERLLRITGKVDAEDLLLTVTDTGVGMDEETRAKLLTNQSPGYGLVNVQERLRLYYGDVYGLTVNSEEGKGTSVEVRLPIGGAAASKRNIDRDR